MTIRSGRHRYVRWNVGCYVPFLLPIAGFFVIGITLLLLGWPAIRGSSDPAAPQLMGIFLIAITALLGRVFGVDFLRLAFDEVVGEESQVIFRGAFSRSITIPFHELALVKEMPAPLTVGGRVVEVRGRAGRFSFTNRISGYAELYEVLRGAWRANGTPHR
jgi:hypothetical protein